MKTMLVTGASSGIGRALAIRAARAGYAVYAVARNADALSALHRSIEGEHGFITTEVCDVAIAANAAGLIARTLDRYGSLDVLVNNAGFVSSGPLSAQSDAELQRQFATHAIGPVALVREALAALRASRGHVFMLGSGVARVPIGGLGAYPSAKAALRSATSILRRELRLDDIAVTYVDPGAVDTPFMQRAGMPGAPASLLVSPEAVARKILIAVGARPRILNAAPWQTALVGLAELFPRLTDALLERVPSLVGVPAALPLSDVSAALPPVASVVGVETVTPARAPAALTAAPRGEVSEPVHAADGFTVALEPHRRRMEKLGLRESFVRELLVPSTTLETGEVAMRWAGMPNKHERAITGEVLEALTGAGLLERTADQTYRVME